MGDCFLDLDFFNWTDHLVLTRFLRQSETIYFL